MLPARFCAQKLKKAICANQTIRFDSTRVRDSVLQFIRRQAVQSGLDSVECQDYSPSTGRAWGCKFRAF
jgi:hypothetical protein